MSAALSCENQPISLLRTIIDLLICILVIGALAPQIVRFAIIDRSSGTGVSGWYMILLTPSANVHLAARTGGTFTKASYDCIRNGNLSGWKGLSALIMCLQVLVHWIAAITLLVIYVYSRHGHSNDYEYYSVPTHDGDAGARGSQLELSEQPSTPSVYSTTTAPSNTAIVAIVATHAVIVIPPALYILLHKVPVYDDVGFGLFQQLLYMVLAITGIITSVAAPVPQVYLMVSRSSEGLGLGNLSVLSTGLQILAYAALCVSQCARLWFWYTNDDIGLTRAFLFWLLDVSGPAVTYGVLALGQLVVLGVALLFGREHGSLYV
ncbi:hypothetical protein BJX63DRAFT_429692 [Aspergillus granulosus]|uniref:PQ loop repeat protein n=1 Tax=Aspergillus granulosus TaxID=176169 RepID=A0ABR4HR86_9EURO